MIRKHFVGRIAELSRQVSVLILISLEFDSLFIPVVDLQVQDSDGKCSHYYAEVCSTALGSVVYNTLFKAVPECAVPGIAQTAESQLGT